jgi:hypothetical protein
MSTSIANEIADYERRYAEFMHEARFDVEELLTTGRMTQAMTLSAATGQHLNHGVFPMFFTGDLDASVVLVHLNPRQDEDHSDRATPPFAFTSFEEYFEQHRYFGAYHFGARATARHYSRFDAKQVRFLRPFGVLDFVDEVDESARLLNLERVVDHKLQMELIPYGSPNFETNRFTAGLIRQHFDRVLRVVCSHPRRYVFFCGNAFAPVLRDYVIDDQSFYLTKSDGNPDGMRSRFANLRIPFSGEVVSAGLCHSWARQGIPMRSYGEEVAARYSAG